jgi:hypothetical protein
MSAQNLLAALALLAACAALVWLRTGPGHPAKTRPGASSRGGLGESLLS